MIIFFLFDSLELALMAVDTSFIFFFSLFILLILFSDTDTVSSCILDFQLLSYMCPVSIDVVRACTRWSI